MCKRHTLLLTAALITFFETTAGGAVETDFKYGGYVKFDAIGTYFRNGDVAAQNPLRDFHIPALVPVGDRNNNYHLDFHAKESRVNFTTLSTFPDDSEVKGFLEMDFLLSGVGDERVSNSFNPRLRHFYLSTERWTFGQTWSTFQVVVLPENLDFIGATEGTVFIRQPQVRFTSGPWQVALENPETVVRTSTPIRSLEAGARLVTETAVLPDAVVRRNFSGDWGTLGLTAIARQLSYADPETDIDGTDFGFGLSAGGMLRFGGDDIRWQATGGRGLGRYVGANFIDAAAMDSTGAMTPIPLAAGFLGWRHLWNESWRSTIDVSLLFADNPAELPGSVNANAQSGSINLLYSPNPGVTFGIEYMRARRELKNGSEGQFDRVQFSAIYNFNYSPAP